MMKIYKYVFTGSLCQTFAMPSDAEVLSAQLQDDQVVIWAKVDETIPSTNFRSFSVFGTGWDIDDSPRRFVATVQQNGFVWHVFENLNA